MAGKKKKLKIVKKPYLTGAPADNETIKGALSVFGISVGMMILFLILGMLLQFENLIINVVINLCVLALTYSIFYVSGISRGTIAVNQGEIMYEREKTGRPYTAEELKRCYHPAKGFINGLVGVLPALIISAILAVIAQKQSYSIGVLPSWVTSLSQNRPELAQPLAYYSASEGMTLEAGLRIVIRILNMPYVSMLNATNYDNMLLLERISPLLALLPGISYGIGYFNGVRVRTRVHSEIAASKRKRKKASAKKSTGVFQLKEKKPRTPKGPEQLN